MCVPTEVDKEVLACALANCQLGRRRYAAQQFVHPVERVAVGLGNEILEGNLHARLARRYAVFRITGLFLGILLFLEKILMLVSLDCGGFKSFFIYLILFVENIRTRGS